MRSSFRRLFRGALRMTAAALAASVIPQLAIAEHPDGMPRLFTDQQYIEDANAASDLDVTNPKAVLKFVLDGLPDTAKVYPTENYFYFHFYHGGIRWAGNLRFDVETRNDGKVHMTYFKDFTAWQQDGHDYTVVWSAADGVQVETVRDLVYRVTFGGKSVVFELNDLSKVTPPPGAVRKEEKYLGPVFDESGIRFFLVFNPEVKAFHYILDETVMPPEEFFTATVSPERHDRAAHRLRSLQGSLRRPADPRRGACEQLEREQLSRWPVRSIAGQFPEGRGTPGSDIDRQPRTEGHARPVRKLG